MKKYLNWRAFRYAVTDPELRPLLGVVWAAAIVVTGVIVVTSAGVISAGLFLAPALVALAIHVASVVAGMRYWDSAMALHKRALLENWVSSADSNDERARRRAIFESSTLDAALASAGMTSFANAPDFSPNAGPEIRFNVNGMPMVPGAGVDVTGNPEGYLPPLPQFNSDAGSWSTPGNSYTSPLGSSDNRQF